MRFISVFSLFFLSFLGFCLLIRAQQAYVAETITNCSNTANSALGYSCNGLNTSCQSYLIFRSQDPYNSVTSISTLLSSDPSQLSAINSVSDTATFDAGKMVIVPINCSCSGIYSQANTSYVVQANDGPFFIANNIYQGLSTCQAINDQNKRSTVNLFRGQKLTIPLRCACPASNQSDLGIKYLLSYLVISGDSVSAISERFGGNVGWSLDANEITETSIIYPSTTLLIPLENPPSSNQTITTSTPPSQPTPSSSRPTNSSSKTLVYVIAGVVGGIEIAAGLGAIAFFAIPRCRKQSDPVAASEKLEVQVTPLNTNLSDESQEFSESSSSIPQSIKYKYYKFEELEAATNNFSADRLIQGSIYCCSINGVDV